jgi:RNA polymerase sigma-70 factor, ECF subfamily
VRKRPDVAPSIDEGISREFLNPSVFFVAQCGILVSDIADCQENRRELDMDQDKHTLDFLRLFVRHQHEIYTYVLALVPHVHDADDLFQEGVTVMWRKFDQFKPGTNFAAWGVRIMHYEILVHRRNLARDKRITLADSVFEALTDRIPAIQDEAPSRIEALRKCRTRLDDRAKRIIKMRFELDLPMEEIASYLKLSRRHAYHVLGQITGVLLRCMRKTLAEGSRPI